MTRDNMALFQQMSHGKLNYTVVDTIVVSELRTRGGGTIEIDGLTPGLYPIDQVSTPGLFSSTPDTVTVTVQAGSTVNVGFGDWGGLHVWLPMVMEIGASLR